MASSNRPRACGLIQGNRCSPTVNSANLADIPPALADLLDSAESLGCSQQVVLKVDPGTFAVLEALASRLNARRGAVARRLLLLGLEAVGRSRP